MRLEGHLLDIRDARSMIRDASTQLETLESTNGGYVSTTTADMELYRGTLKLWGAYIRLLPHIPELVTRAIRELE